MLFLLVSTYMTSGQILPLLRDLTVPIVVIALQPSTKMDHDTFGTGEWLAYAGSAGLPEMGVALERLGKPVWLPNDQLDKQVAFYLRRDAEIVEQHDFTSGDAGNEIRTAPSATPTQGVAIARASRVKQSPNAPVTVIARAKAQLVRTQPAKSRPVAAPEPITAVVNIEPMPAPPQERAPWIRPARFATSNPSAVATESEPLAAPSDVAALFREKHGTNYDPASHLDREKMQILRQEAHLRDGSQETRTF